MAETDVDVLIVGAGISGIGMACHLSSRLPGKRFTVLEARDAIGGTWDLFRYPGIRSDSDLYTFGFEFKPWTSRNMIADAHEIVAYLQEAIDEHHIGDRIRLGHKVVSASWSSEDARWTVRVAHDGEETDITARWYFSATGYYDYEAGYRPEFPGEEDFGGQIIHPQSWPEDLDYDGRRVVVIGSGATAVTLVPAMAERAGHVTMLQRSPSYILPVPRRNALANALLRALPLRVAHRINRRMNIAAWKAMYRTSRDHPRGMRRAIRAVNKLLLPADHPVDVHFRPAYEPWDQRLCAVPDADLFKAIKARDASVVTDTVARFTRTGVELASGRHLDADIIVTATGLRMLPFGGIPLSVDGAAVVPSETVGFKSMMVSGVPNFAFALGYTNISWTLKVDLVCEHLCRLLAHMDARGHDVVTPELDGEAMELSGWFGDFSAGYMQRGQLAFPRRGSRGPWQVDMDYAGDVRRLREGPVLDPALRFRRAGSPAGVPATR